MLRLISKLPGLKVSNLEVLRFCNFKVPNLKLPKFKDFSISKLQSFKLSTFQIVRFQNWLFYAMRDFRLPWCSEPFWCYIKLNIGKNTILYKLYIKFSWEMEGFEGHLIHRKRPHEPTPEPVWSWSSSQSSDPCIIVPRARAQLWPNLTQQVRN